MQHDGFKTAEEAADFIFGGNATFTVTSLKTGRHFTFKVRLPKDADDTAPLMVSVLNGPDNWANYEYIGFIPAIGGGHFKHELIAGRKGHPDAPSFKALAWTMEMLARGREPDDQVRIQHEGKCCRCNRKLTRPESIASGIGPECAKRGS